MKFNCEIHFMVVFYYVFLYAVCYFSNGFGKFMCDYYGGQNNICSEEISDKKFQSIRPNDCTDLCITCPEEELWEDITDLCMYTYIRWCVEMFNMVVISGSYFTVTGHNKIKFLRPLPISLHKSEWGAEYFIFYTPVTFSLYWCRLGHTYYIPGTL